MNIITFTFPDCPSRECYPGTICNKREQPCCTSPSQCTGISRSKPFYLFIFMQYLFIIFLRGTVILQYCWDKTIARSRDMYL